MVKPLFLLSIRKNPQGTTLVEITLYLAIVGIFLLVAMTFAIQIFNANQLSANFNELQSNLDLVTTKLVYAVQTAESINDSGSLFDQDSGTLSLNKAVPADSPTIFSLDGGAITMKEGTGPVVPLTTTAVITDQLRFHKISAPKTPDQVVIDISMSNVANDIANLNQVFPLHLTISLRQ